VFPPALTEDDLTERESMAGTGIGRRDFLGRAIGAAASAAGFTAAPRRARAQGGEVVVCTWGGTYTEAQRKVKCLVPMCAYHKSGGSGEFGGQFYCGTSREVGSRCRCGFRYVGRVVMYNRCKGPGPR
jgi:hypothetical protein